MNFDTFNFHPSIMAGVRELGYTVPTPIQAQAIQPILQGRDLIGLAQTGTGKTAASRYARLSTTWGVKAD